MGAGDTFEPALAAVRAGRRDQDVEEVLHARADHLAVVVVLAAYPTTRGGVTGESPGAR